jgi:hypothetical protein
MGLKQINYFLAGFIIVMSIVLASFFIFTDLMIDSIFGLKRTVFIFILYGYSIYRAFRLYKTVKSEAE